MSTIHVPDMPGPRVQLCWQQGPLMNRCDRRVAHLGPHTWEMAAEVKVLRGKLDAYEVALDVARDRLSLEADR